MSPIRVIAASIACGLTAVAASANASTYSIDLYNVDDNAYAYLTNSKYNDLLVAQSGFSQTGTGYIDITKYITSGANTLTIEDYNTFAGWTISYDFQENGVSVQSFSCGVFNTFGCNNNAYTPGLAFTNTIDFVGEGVAGVPEPATWAMLILGVAMIGFAARRRNGGMAVAA